MPKRINEGQCCCPICGYEFEEVQNQNICPRHQPTETFTPEELIDRDADYAYVE